MVPLHTAWVISTHNRPEHFSSGFFSGSGLPAARNASLASSRLSAAPPFGPWLGARMPICVHSHSSRPGAARAINAADGTAGVTDFVIIRPALAVMEDRVAKGEGHGFFP